MQRGRSLDLLTQNAGLHQMAKYVEWEKLRTSPRAIAGMPKNVGQEEDLVHPISKPGMRLEILEKPFGEALEFLVQPLSLSMAIDHLNVGDIFRRMSIENTSDAEKLKREFVLSWPTLPEVGMEDCDLVFDHEMDIDSLEEFLQEQGESLSVSFNLDLPAYFPGWFSPFFYLGGRLLGDQLKRSGKRKYPSLTINKILQAAVRD